MNLEYDASRFTHAGLYNAVGKCGWCGELVAEAERNWNGDRSLFICDGCYDELERDGSLDP